MCEPVVHLPEREPGHEWLISADELLAQPDPGPTPFLIEDLIVEGALVAAVGKWKTTKSFGLLEAAISIVTGLPAFGQLDVPEPGPVVYVIEESGRKALWRRLDALARGRAIPHNALADLHLATNERVRLDDGDWQKRLHDAGDKLKPRAFIFDPLVRMKAPSRDENAQGDMAVLIEFLRDLRDATDAAVAFVHHSGHNGNHMRGSSDLESAWESRLEWKKSREIITVSSEHREAEAGPELQYRLAWDETTRSIRLAPAGVDPELLEKVRAHLDKDPDASANTVARAVGGTRKKVLQAYQVAREGGTGTTGNHPLGQPPQGGSAAAPFRAPGTTPELVVPEPGELARMERLIARHSDIADGAA